jgi:hypothetical protein
MMMISDKKRERLGRCGHVRILLKGSPSLEENKTPLQIPKLETKQFPQP